MVTLTKLGKDSGEISISITILAVTNLHHSTFNIDSNFFQHNNFNTFVFAPNFDLFIKPIDLNLINVKLAS